MYLLRKMQTMLNVKTLNFQKQIFCKECESTSFAKINLRKMSIVNSCYLVNSCSY